jgi:hypothetical protein
VVGHALALGEPEARADALPLPLGDAPLEGLPLTDAERRGVAVGSVGVALPRGDDDGDPDPRADAEVDREMEGERDVVGEPLPEREGEGEAEGVAPPPPLAVPPGVPLCFPEAVTLQLPEALPLREGEGDPVALLLGEAAGLVEGALLRDGRGESDTQLLAVTVTVEEGVEVEQGLGKLLALSEVLPHWVAVAQSEPLGEDVPQGVEEPVADAAALPEGRAENEALPVALREGLAHPEDEGDPEKVVVAHEDCVPLGLPCGDLDALGLPVVDAHSEALPDGDVLSRPERLPDEETEAQMVADPLPDGDGLPLLEPVGVLEAHTEAHSVGEGDSVSVPGNADGDCDKEAQWVALAQPLPESVNDVEGVAAPVAEGRGEREEEGLALCDGDSLREGLAVGCSEGVCADEDEGAPAEDEASALRVGDPLIEPLLEAEGDCEGAFGVPVPQGEGDKVCVGTPLALGHVEALDEALCATLALPLPLMDGDAVGEGGWEAVPLGLGDAVMESEPLTLALSVGLPVAQPEAVGHEEGCDDVDAVVVAQGEGVL